MATKKPQRSLVPTIDPLIVTIRGQKVILDRNLAALYGVTTFRFNEAVKRNRGRFPDDFMFQLTRQELAHLISQFAISSSGHGGVRKLPWAFTEHGALMAANVLRSQRAMQMSVYVIRAFVRLREHITANYTVPKRLAEIDKTLLQHDSALCDVYRKLLPLIQPPSDPPKRRIGFHRDEE